MDREREINVTVFLHNLQEAYDDFGARADENLTLSSSFCIGDGFQSIG
jgi:hypothetical protein